MGYGDIKHNKAVQKAIEKGRIEWHMWANTLAVFGASVMVLGGLLGSTLATERKDSVPPIETRSWLFYYAIIAGAVLFVMEWSRGARKQGRTMARSYQEYITPGLVKLGFLWTNLYIRGMLHIGISIALFLELPTIIAGLVMLVAGLVYVKAGFKGEQWKPLVARARREQKGQVIKAPTAAPPRRPESMLVDRHDSAGLMDDQDDLDAGPKPLSLKPKQVANPGFTPKPTVRVPPKAAAPSAPPPSRAPPMPAGRPPRTAAPSRPVPVPQAASKWTAVIDESTGDTYYHNTQTDETTWDKPASMA